jgi:hypothetical protein
MPVPNITNRNGLYSADQLAAEMHVDTKEVYFVQLIELTRWACL